ncbi:MAG: hypothetical protein ACXIUV_04525 [Alkalilacustris sp.]
MNRATIRIAQRKLQEMGHYGGAIDGLRGPLTNAAVEAALPQMGQSLPAGWQGWPATRRFAAFVQALCHAEGIDAGPIDGLVGPQTREAVAALERKDAGGIVHWRDIAPIPDAPEVWPHERDVQAFYGPPGTSWERMPAGMTRVRTPWRLRIAWNPAQHRDFLWAHPKVADSLAEVLEKVHAHYGEAEIRRLRLDVFSGDYNPRRKRGGTAWSMHAYGIAYDFDDINNQLSWRADRASFARPEYDDWWRIWEEEGWVSLGRSRDFDWMHIQAARV